MKRIAIVVVAVILLALAATVGYIATIDFNDYRDVIAARVEKETGRKITFAGLVEGHVFTLSPRLTATDVTFANAPWGAQRPMVRAKRIELRLALLPLIWGRLYVERLIVADADILLETSAHGVGNWQFGNADGRPKAARAGAATETPAIPVIHDVRIVNSRLTYKDGVARETTSIHFQRLTVHTPGAAAPVRVDIDGELDGVAVKTTGTVGSIEMLRNRAKIYPVKLAMAWSKSDLRLDLRVDRSAKLNRIAGTVSSRRLDLDGSGRGKRKRGGKGRLFGDARIPAGLLRAADADLQLTAARLDLGGQRFDGVTAKVSVKSGELRLAPFAAKVAGGTAAGQLVVDGSGPVPVLTLEAKGRNLAMADVTKSWFGKAAMATRMRLDMSVTGRGASVRAIMASLSGRTVFVGGPGPIRAGFFDLLSKGVITSIAPWAKRDQPLALSCIVGRFDFAKGIGRSRLLVIDTTRATLTGSGAVDLRGESVDLLFRPKTKQASAASVAALVPIRVRGPLRKPQVAGDPKSLPKEAARSLIGIVKNPLDAASRVIGKKTGGTTVSPCAQARARLGARVPPSGPALPPKRRAPPKKKKDSLFKRLNPFD